MKMPQNSYGVNHWSFRNWVEMLLYSCLLEFYLYHGAIGFLLHFCYKSNFLVWILFTGRHRGEWDMSTHASDPKFTPPPLKSIYTPPSKKFTPPLKISTKLTEKFLNLLYTSQKNFRISSTHQKKFRLRRTMILLTF